MGVIHFQIFNQQPSLQSTPGWSKPDVQTKDKQKFLYLIFNKFATNKPVRFNFPAVKP